MGNYGRPGCETYAVAKLQGYTEPPTTAMLVGSYVDAYYQGPDSSQRFRAPGYFRGLGTLKADFIKAERMIARAERDELFRNYMSGGKQVIMTGELFGAEWKIKMDNYLPARPL